MPNLFFQGAEIAMSSGTVNDTYALIQRVQDINVSFQIPRTDVRVLGKFHPLNDRPVLNYTPVTVSCSYTKGNKDVETCWGLLNTTGIATLIGQNTDVATWGARSFQVYNVPINTPNASNYAGQWNVASGVLKTFSLQGSVGSPVRGSFTAECLDLQQVANGASRTIPNYNGQVIKSENILITGINFTGLGFSGIIVQSFNFQTTFNHASTFRLGTKYPERRITDAVATLQIEGFMEGMVPTITGLNTYDCGTFITGLYSLSLSPSCSTDPATIITMAYPYLETQAVGTQVGNYTTVSLTLSTPLSIVPAEVLNAQVSNVTIT